MDDADQGVEEFGALFYEECSKKKKSTQADQPGNEEQDNFSELCGRMEKDSLIL